MPSTSVQEYIVQRLEVGDSAESIANQLHGWGWRVLSGAAPSRLQTSKVPSRSIPRFSLPTLLLTISLVALTASTFAYYHLTQTDSSQLALGSESTQLAQSREPEVLAAQTESPEEDTAILPMAMDDNTSASSTESATTAPHLINTTSATTPTATAGATLKKNEYTIAIIGDSMIDTLDEKLGDLTTSLKGRYDAQFIVYNYGVGSENAEMAIDRFSQDLSYQNRGLLALSKLKPDVIIINSFAYNPFDPHDVNKHWLALATLVEHARAITPQVYLLADIAPKHSTFGQGSLDWTLSVRTAHAKKVRELLENTQRLAESLNVPLIDVYTQTADETGYGSSKYTSSDGIHPSSEGIDLTFESIVAQLDLQ